MLCKVFREPLCFWIPEKAALLGQGIALEELGLVSAVSSPSSADDANVRPRPGKF